MRPLLPIPIILLVMIFTAGCNLTYKPEIQQGVLLSTEMLGNLKPGMNKRQVRLLLGTAPVMDTFHPERWDYVYYTGKAGESFKIQRLTLFFSDDKLKDAAGDLAPATLAKPADKSSDSSAPDSSSAGPAN